MSVWEEIGWVDPLRREEALYRLARALGKRSLEDIYVDGKKLSTEELTEAEIRIVNALSHGVGQQGVADILGLSIFTVKTHLKRIKAKLGAKDSIHVVAKALREGIID